jgi:hypothetical protein
LNIADEYTRKEKRKNEHPDRVGAGDERGDRSTEVTETSEGLFDSAGVGR